MTRLGSVEHLLAVNDIRVRVVRGCHDLGWSLHSWQQPEELAPLLKSERLVPDAYFKIRRVVDGNERTSAFCLELERVAKSREVLRSKLRRYSALYYGGRYEKVFGSRSLRLLVVFCSQNGASCERLVAGAMDEAKRMGVTIARFADLGSFKALSPAAFLTERFWRTPGDEAPVALFNVAGQGRVQS